jgi:hypothetical protein
MKKRIGFVSNSSSASFVVPKAVLSKVQRKKLLQGDTSIKWLDW